MTIWQPTEPWTIRSGEHKDKTLEQLMFDFYSKYHWQFHQYVESNNPQRYSDYGRHLEWLLDRAEKLYTIRTCEFCNTRLITQFSVRYSATGEYSIAQYYTCCDDDECQSQLTNMEFGGNIQLLPFKFSSLLGFKKRTLKRVHKDIRDLFVWAFVDGKRRLTKEVAWGVFQRCIEQACGQPLLPL